MDGFKEDQQVVYDAGGGTAIGGLNDGSTYYVHLVALHPSEVQLKTTQGDNSTIVNTLSGGTGENQRVVPTNQPGVPKDHPPRFNPGNDVAANTIKLPYTPTLNPLYPSHNTTL